MQFFIVTTGKMILKQLLTKVVLTVLTIQFMKTIWVRNSTFSPRDPLMTTLENLETNKNRSTVQILFLYKLLINFNPLFEKFFELNEY